LTTLKIAVHAPIPSAMVNTAVSVRAGDLRSVRVEYRTSSSIVVM
jgi:hypothetical protein